MQLARHRYECPDGHDYAILASQTDSHVWFDVRAVAAQIAHEQGATKQAARQFARTVVPSSMAAALAMGSLFTDAARQAIERADPRTIVNTPQFANAVDPVSYRDFMVFEEHFSFGYRWQDKPVPDVMYELPVSYAGDPLSFIGPGDVIPWPSYTRRLDYELEIGIVIGREGTNLNPDTALDHVAGLTILNDVSARDIQGREMTGGLGPSKGKHFACVTGPVLTTLDDLPDRGLEVTGRVNGEVLCSTNTAQMVWSVAEIVAWASQGETLRPGALLGTGTCNGGSTIELGVTIAPGDRVEMEVDRLGVLTNTFGEPGINTWTPQPRPRRADGTANQLHFLR